MDRLSKFYVSAKTMGSNYDFSPAMEYAETAFANGQFLQSIFATLTCLNFDTLPSQLNVKIDEKLKLMVDQLPKRFSLHHGSLVMNFEVDSKFKMSVPFLKIPKEKKLALYRQLSQINQDLLMLSSFTLKDDTITMDFECELSAAHPHKISHLMYEVCKNADKFDDLFVDKFGASLVQEVKATRPQEAQLEQIYKDYQSAISWGLSAVDDYVKSNKMTHAYYAVYAALFQLDYIFEAQGVLGSKFKDVMSKCMSAEWAASIPMVRAFLVEVQQLTKEKFFESCYFSQFIVAPKHEVSAMGLTKFLNGFKERIDARQSEGEYELVALMTTWLFYKSTFDMEIPFMSRQMMASALAGSAEAPWQQAAMQLVQIYELLINVSFAEMAA